jgi:hypothetical protein
MIRKLLFLVALCTSIISCKNNEKSIQDILLSNDSASVDFIGEHYVDAFKEHILINYEGKNIDLAVQERPFLFYCNNKVFKMDIDTIINYKDSLTAIRFHGALDSLIGFNSHVNSAPQALGIFVKKGDKYFLKQVVDVSTVFFCPWGSSTSLELHFENTDWPGPMLFSKYTDGNQGTIHEYVNAIDLSLNNLGYERFRFSNTIHSERTFYSDNEDLKNAGFPQNRITQPWKEVNKITERKLNYIFNEEHGTINVLRNSKTYWDISVSTKEVAYIMIMDSKSTDTLKYSIQGGIFSPN